MISIEYSCDQCGGRGKITKHVCAVCKGNRIVDSTAELNLHVDRGVPEGTEVVFEGEADESPDFVAGDIVLRIRSRRSVGGFERRGSNLYWRETLSVAEVRGFDSMRLGLTRNRHYLDSRRASRDSTATPSPYSALERPSLVRIATSSSSSASRAHPSQVSCRSSLARDCRYTTTRGMETSTSSTPSSSLPLSLPRRTKVRPFLSPCAVLMRSRLVVDSGVQESECRAQRAIISIEQFDRIRICSCPPCPVNRQHKREEGEPAQRKF